MNNASRSSHFHNFYDSKPLVSKNCWQITKSLRAQLPEGSRATLEAGARLEGNTWQESEQRWRLRFANVKKDAHDLCVLVAETPDNLHVLWWNGKGYSTTGEREAKEGGQIVIVGECRRPSLSQSIKVVLEKLNKPGEKMHGTEPLLETIAIGNPHYGAVWATTTVGADLYAAVPLGPLQPQPRGDALEALARRVIAEVCGVEIVDAEVTPRVDGAKRGKHQTTCDFRIVDEDGHEKCEAKSSLMSYNIDTKRYRLEFCRIKVGKFKRLFLTWMSPRGVHVFEWQGAPSVATGACTTPGSRGQTDWEEAEQTLLTKMTDTYGMTRLAFLPFAEGDVAAYDAACRQRREEFVRKHA